MACCNEIFNRGKGEKDWGSEEVHSGKDYHILTRYPGTHLQSIHLVVFHYGGLSLFTFDASADLTIAARLKQPYDETCARGMYYFTKTIVLLHV
jgi:hypothetical protein